MSLFDHLQQARRAFGGAVPDPSASALLAAELASVKADLELARRRVAELRDQLEEAETVNAALAADLAVLRAPARRVAPSGPAHRPCRDAAQRVCAHCAPVLGFTSPPGTGLAEIGRKQRAWVADRANQLGGAVIV